MAKNKSIYSKLEVSKYVLLFFAVFFKKLKVDPQSAGQPKAHTYYTYTKQSLKHAREKRTLLRAMWWMFSLLNMLNPANEY